MRLEEKPGEDPAIGVERATVLVGPALILTSAVLACGFALAGCYSDEGYQLPAKAMKELSPEMLTLLQKKNMPKESTILVRVFKEESELELWKADRSGRFALLRTYPICRWSGSLGPKFQEGDGQAEPADGPGGVERPAA